MTNTTKQITITVTPTGWIADFARASSAAEIMALFGTTILPLPWTAHASPETVRADLAAREPDHMIVIAQ